MKMMVAIVNKDDASIVNSALREEGFTVTKIASTGGFLSSGNTTFLIGTEDDAIDRAIEIIGKFSKKRVQPAPLDISAGIGIAGSFPTEVTVGGATIFVLNVESFYRV